MVLLAWGKTHSLSDQIASEFCSRLKVADLMRKWQRSFREVRATGRHGPKSKSEIHTSLSSLQTPLRLRGQSMGARILSRVPTPSAQHSVNLSTRDAWMVHGHDLTCGDPITGFSKRRKHDSLLLHEKLPSYQHGAKGRLLALERGHTAHLRQGCDLTCHVRKKQDHQQGLSQLGCFKGSNNRGLHDLLEIISFMAFLSPPLR